MQLHTYVGMYVCTFPSLKYDIVVMLPSILKLSNVSLLPLFFVRNSVKLYGKANFSKVFNRSFFFIFYFFYFLNFFYIDIISNNMGYNSYYQLFNYNFFFFFFFFVFFFWHIVLLFRGTLQLNHFCGMKSNISS